MGDGVRGGDYGLGVAYLGVLSIHVGVLLIHPRPWAMLLVLFCVAVACAAGLLLAFPDGDDRYFSPVTARLFLVLTSLLALADVVMFFAPFVLSAAADD